jgi:hypothetical protein
MTVYTGTVTGRIQSAVPNQSNAPQKMSENASQTGHGWTGVLVLKGNFDISPIYKPALEQTGEYNIVFGDSQQGLMDFREVSVTTPRAEAVAHVAQKLPVKPYSLFVCGDIPRTMHVPTRNTTIALWSQGHCALGFQRMIENVVQLNREPTIKEEKSNYARTVREKIFELQTGKYAVCLGYFSRHPRIILSTRNMEIYSWIVHYNGVYSFVWSTDHSYMDRVKNTLEAVKQNELFYLNIPLESVSLLVVHPLYWITKFNKVLNSMKSGSSKLSITTYFKNYLLRQNNNQPAYMDMTDGN